MKDYTCIKKVKAMQIHMVKPCDDGSYEISDLDGHVVSVGGAWYDAQLVAGKTNTLVGRYLVEYYPDGYLSVSPTGAFKSGYIETALIDADLIAKIERRIKAFG